MVKANGEMEISSEVIVMQHSRHCTCLPTLNFPLSCCTAVLGVGREFEMGSERADEVGWADSAIG